MGWEGLWIMADEPKEKRINRKLNKIIRLLEEEKK